MIRLFVLVLVLGVAATADADLYKYRDTQGRMHITNQFTSIPPEYRDQALRNSHPESRPSPALTAQPSVPSEPVAASPATPATPANADLPSEIRQSQASPVSTAQFAAIQHGMAAAEVLRRLGSPARTEDMPATRVGTNTIRDGVLISRSREVPHFNWIYPAGQGLPATVIRFTDGEVADIYRAR